MVNLKTSGVSADVVFQQLDVTNPVSITSFADFISNQFGKLDIFVNNAGINGIVADDESLTSLSLQPGELSTSPRIVNISSGLGKLEMLEQKGWDFPLSAYIVSKAAINAYTPILAKKHPSFCINAVAPGFVKTDMTHHKRKYTVEEGARGPVKL
ncbi:(+)-neomenthol dehydrogenase-like protein [Tanacetum coccineum]